ncbi:MAG: PQQ-binding-like beta-propeller repeat protein [Synergistaceae bacterium]|nr:PQQ-binding-like beta-propeller repeat protein [Synergistaceae bacterium]
MRKKIFIAVLLPALFAASQAWAFTGRTKWQVNLESGITSGIAESENVLLLGTETGKFYALNKDTGSEVWSYIGTNTIKGTPSVINNNVVFAQGDGTITCLKIADGSLMWQSMAHAGEGVTIDDGTAAGGGMIFASKSDGKLYALDAKNGHLLWTYKAGEQGVREAPGYGDGFVFLGEYGGIMSIISPHNGKRVNGGGAGGAINTPVIKNGKVYYSSWDGSVQAVQIKDVIPLWDVKIGDPVTTSPAVGEGIVAVGTVRGTIAAIDEANGNILWKFETNGNTISGNPIISEGLVFAGTASGTIYAIDKSSGKVRFNLETGSGFETNPVLSEGIIYFGDNGGTVYALQ